MSPSKENPATLTAPDTGEHPLPLPAVVTEGGAYDGHVDQGVLGSGGMGEVRRVVDPGLRRSVAMKILRAELVGRGRLRHRFLEEAQVTAQLQHPGIVPVHRLGTLPDGRLYFTMREVRGETFATCLQRVRAASAPRSWGQTADGWTFHRLIDAIQRAADAVAYAHSRGVLHRDLKPENVMLGAHGEVLVVDWGLAKVVGRSEVPVEDVQTSRRLTAWQTRVGQVSGTPAYMPPEQARGEVERLGPWSDVYALGATLYSVLHGQPPYEGDDGLLVLARVAREEPFDPVPEGGPPAPPELLAIAQRATAARPEDRYPDAGAFSAALLRWRDGALRREQAERTLAEAVATLAQARERATLARSYDKVASTLRDEEAWEEEDRAAKCREEAERLELDAEQKLRAALVQDPELADAHRLLAERYLVQHREAEAQRDERAARRFQRLLAEHAAALGPSAHPGLEAYLRGQGSLTLETDPPGVVVELYRYERLKRRLTPVKVGLLGRTPLRDVALERGSYLLVLSAPGGVRIRWPACIERQERLVLGQLGGRPGPLRLPRSGELGLDEVLVPAGRFVRGGDGVAVGSSPRAEAYLESFVLRRFPVTNREYIVFLDALVASGRVELARQLAPRERGGTVGEVGALIYGQHPDGRFFTRPDADGDEWRLEDPVMMVDHRGASLYAAWLAHATGLPYRLPTSDEVEKAARGVDGRYHPWGDDFDPHFCVMRDTPSSSTPWSLERCPVDESPYGVRHLAGLVRTWCADRGQGTRFVNRGGYLFANERDCRSADRHFHEPTHRAAEIGFRLARDWPPPAVRQPGSPLSFRPEQP